MAEEFSMDSASESAFEDIFRLTRDISGIVLTKEKSQMVYSRLRPRLRALNIEGIDKYFKYVSSSEGEQELENMISALTTNVSHFFREQHHFDILSKALEDNQRDQRTNDLRIWSAGCSNGQEPYSIAMQIAMSSSNQDLSRAKILATDIDKGVLQFAKLGQYSKSLLSGLEKHHEDRFFSQLKKDGETFLEASPSLKSLITFKKLNLLEDWPMKKCFDFIFCRNVLIYFDTETQDGLWPRFKDKLKPGGLLFLGHSERISMPETFGLALSGPTTYQRIN